jgi:hypothetical protein
VTYFQHVLGLADPAPPSVANTFDYIAYVNGTDSTSNTGFGTGYLPSLNSSVDNVSFLGYNPDIEGYNMIEADYAWDYTPTDVSPFLAELRYSIPTKITTLVLLRFLDRAANLVAYVIASDLGSSTLYSTNYCNCGGIVAPLITQTVSGSLPAGCVYQTQPTANSCPQGPPTSTSITAAPTASLYCSNPSLEDGDGLVRVIKALLPRL